MVNFSHQTVVVSGAGHGIGKEIALTFAAEKAKVIFFDKDQVKVEEVKKKLQELHINFMAEVLDITNLTQVSQFIKSIKKQFGQVDILVNNIGIGAQKRFFNITPKLLANVWQTNFQGPFYLTQKVSQIMPKGGNIIFISSIHAHHPSLDPAYDSTKAGIDSLIGNLSLQLASQDIRVNGIAPGHIETSLSAPQEKPAVPLSKKAGYPKDIAEACLFLANNQKARYITGIIMPVTGGLHIPIAKDINF